MQLTPTESRIVQMLSVRACTTADLVLCLGDEYAEEATIRVHIANLRKKLRPGGNDIICDGDYRLTRLFSDPNDGKT